MPSKKPTAEKPAAAKARTRTRKDAQAEQPEGAQDQQQPGTDGVPAGTQADEPQDAQDAQDRQQTEPGVVARVFDVDELEPWPDLPTRKATDYDPADPEMVELTESMEAYAAASGLPYGNFEAIQVHPRAEGRSWIVAGRRRWTGAGLKGLKVLALVREWTEAEAHVTALAENIHHKTLSFMAEAEEMAVLRERFGMELEEIAAKIGKTHSYVSKRLTVLRLPAWVRRLIDTDELSPSVAYDGFGVYASVPEPAASALWTQAEQWYNRVKQGGRRPTAEQIRQGVGDIAVSLSRTMDPKAAYRNEEAPAFDAATHDAACECGRPRIAIQQMFTPHERCYNVPVWLRLQADAKEARQREIRERAASKPGNGNGKKDEAPQAPEGSAPTPAPAPTQAAQPMDSPAPILRAYDEPTWAEYMAGRSGRADDYCLAGDETRDNMKEAHRMVVDWTALPLEQVHYVQAPAERGTFRIVCDDADAVKKAKEAAQEKIQAAAQVLREQAQAAFRKQAQKVDERSPEALAVLLYDFPNAGSYFVQETARLLGIDYTGSTTAEAFRKLPKNRLTLLMQGVAFRYLNGQTARIYDNSEQDARAQVYAEQAADFAALIDGLPKPEPTPAGRVQELARLIEDRWEPVSDMVQPGEAGAFADELAEYGDEWRTQIAAFRAAVEAVTETAEAHGVDLSRVLHVHGEGGTVRELVDEAAELLSHPTIATIEAAPQQEKDAGQAPQEGAAPEAGPEQQEDAGQAPQEGAAPEAGPEQQEDAGQAPQEGAAPEAGPEQQEDAGQAPAPVEPDSDGVVRPEPGSVREKRSGGGKKRK